MYLGVTKDDFDASLMELFRSADKREAKWSGSGPPFEARRWAQYLQHEDEEIDVVYYSAAVPVVRDRLELKGYTFETAKAAFREWISAEHELYSGYLKPGTTFDFYQRKVNLFKELDVDDWLATLRLIKAGSLDSLHPMGLDEETLKGYMLKNDWYGYAGVEPYIPLRLALETCAETDNFVYDLTDLILAEEYSAQVDFVELASQFNSERRTLSSKIIVLTEGRSDRWIISESIKLLYPHLFDFFTFLDFDAARVEGGAGSLAAIVKAFAGTGIVNKVVAIFDNDTAGEAAIRTLRHVKLPGNIQIVKLPVLEMLDNYPTIGPTGPTVMDVNGMAASIELYLGTDALSDQGRLRAIQWTGYNAALGKYQGEILGKERIHAKFRQQLDDSRGIPPPDDENWSGIRNVLSSLFSTFHTFDREQLFVELRKSYSHY